MSQMGLKNVLISQMSKRDAKKTQWGWLSGYTLGLKVAVLGLTRNSLVQVQAPAL